MSIERKHQDEQIVKKYAKIEADTIENYENNDIINRKDFLHSLHQESKCIMCTPTSLFIRDNNSSMQSVNV